MQQHESLAVVWRPIGDIRPYPGNPRVIPETAVDKVAASIKAFNWRQPIVVDTSGEIIVGHARYLAAQKLKLATVPVHVAESLTSEEIRAYRLADNRTHDATSWDMPVLEAELQALADFDFDLSLTGFDPGEWPAPPDFTPSDEPTSKPLDHLTEITCPACGHKFEAGAKR